LPLIAVDARPALPRISGVGRYVLNLVINLAHVPGVRLAVIVGPNPHRDLINLKGIDVIDGGAGAGDVGFVQRLRWEQKMLRRVLSRAGADLYHATWNYGVPWASPCPSVLTVHDLIPMHRPEFGSRSYRAAFLVSQYVALTRASAIIAVSQSTAAEIARYAPWTKRRVTVIHEAADPIFRPHTPHSGNEASPDDRANAPYLLYVGGLSGRKNIVNLLRAFEIVSGVDEGVSLKVTGDVQDLEDDARSAYETMNPSARHRIAFVSRLTDCALVALYQGAAALVHPSFAEGFGFPPLEAMASGIPVVTTRSGSIPEIVQHHAVFVDPDNAASIADGILRVMNSEPLRTQLIAGGLSRAAELTWQRAADETAQVYSRVLSLGRGTHQAAK
jgi:glycosyltransferase involved in cell wall biosynthesis